MRKKLLFGLIFSFLFASLYSPTIQADQTSGFSDTSKHWAKDYISQLYTLGFVKGYEDNTYKPDFPMTRAEFTSLLINSMGLSPSDSTSKHFSDTNKHWALGYINEAVTRGILLPSEYPSGLQPDASIKRSEVAAMLMRALAQSPASGSTTFKDQGTINQSMYKGYIKGAADLGLMSGDTEGNFNPFGNMKRGEICRVVSVFLSKQNTSTSNAPNSSIVSGETLHIITIGENTYDCNLIPVSFKSNLKEIPISNLATAGSVLQVNGQYNFALDSSVDNPDIIISNRRYGIARMQVMLDKLVVTPSGDKINTLTHNDQKYTSDYIKVYLNSADSQSYLSEMIISDENNVLINGESYSLDENKISIGLGSDFYDITSITITTAEILLQIEETDRLVASEMDMGDFSDIYVNDRELDLDDISTPEFIIDGNRKKLKEITMDGAGHVLMSNTSYTASQITVIIDESYYQLNQVVMDNSGDFVLYCSDSDVDEWIVVNNKYCDEEDLQLVYDDIAYDMDDVNVVDHNKIRVNGKQRTLDASFKLKMNGLLYDIEDVDEGDDFYIAEFETDKDSYAGGGPGNYLFYNQDAVCYSGDLDAVSIMVDSTWIGFDEISITNPGYFSYSGKTYDLLTAKIEINQVEFEVTDTAWHGQSQKFDLILKPSVL